MRPLYAIGNDLNLDEEPGEDRIPLISLAGATDSRTLFLGGTEPSTESHNKNGTNSLISTTNLIVWMAFGISIFSFLASARSFFRGNSSHTLSSNVACPGELNSLCSVLGNFDIKTLQRPSLYLGLERVPEVKLLLSAERILSFNNPSHMHQDNSTDDHTAYKGGGNDSLSTGNVHVPGDLGVSSTSFSAKTRSFVIPKRTITLTSLYPDESILELNEGWVYVSPWVYISSLSFFKCVLLLS